MQGIDHLLSNKTPDRYIGFRAAVKRIPYRSRSTVNFSRVTGLIGSFGIERMEKKDTVEIRNHRSPVVSV